MLHKVVWIVEVSRGNWITGVPGGAWGGMQVFACLPAFLHLPHFHEQYNSHTIIFSVRKVEQLVPAYIMAGYCNAFFFH